jgi:hydroxymethylbilane synthase
VIFSTRGDQVFERPLPLRGGKGLFTAELEAALREGEIHLAVHSLKDLPTGHTDDLIIAAILPRGDPRDVLISRSGSPLDRLPRGAAIGTSSPRRAAQLLAYRPDLEILDLRGNVDTRVRKALDPVGPYDAVVLARAGLERLELARCITQVLPLDLMLPAPGQGALAVQVRSSDLTIQAIVKVLDDPPTRAAVTAERAFLAGIGGGCTVPVAAYAEVDQKTQRLTLQGRVLSQDGRRVVSVEVHGVMHEAEWVGAVAAEQALRQGAKEILDEH